MSDAPEWIVRRFNWKSCRDGKELRQAPGEHRVAWFDTEADAVAECRRREQSVRERVNPFHCGPAFHYLSTFPEYAFRDWLRDADITPPDGNTLDAWAEWWEWPPLGPSARAKVWEGLNRVRFHDVISRRPSEVAYAVIRVEWEYLDDFYSPGNEGGSFDRVFRTRERAEAEAAMLTTQRKEEWNYYHCGLHVERWQAPNWPFVFENEGA